MDFAAYVEGALRLVNEPLDSAADLDHLLVTQEWLRVRATPADLAPLQALRARLADVVDRSAVGDEDGVVTRMNALLEANPIRPRISGHDAQSWHLHVSETGAPVAETVAGAALFGLTLLVTEMGADRLGRCAAPGCGRAFLDTSPNRSRRFCSQRCATRVNVAAHRRRARAASS